MFSNQLESSKLVVEISKTVDSIVTIQTALPKIVQMGVHEDRIDLVVTDNTIRDDHWFYVCPVAVRASKRFAICLCVVSR